MTEERKMFGEPDTTSRQHALERLGYVLGYIEQSSTAIFNGQRCLVLPRDDTFWLYRVAHYYLHDEGHNINFVNGDGIHYRKANSVGLLFTDDEVRQFDEDDAKATPRDWGETARDPNSAEEEGKDKVTESPKKKGFFARLFG